MLTSLEMNHYRGFIAYRVAGLSRVNLLVGRNNCGKTSILEAIHLLASGSAPEVFAQIAERRGELIASRSDRHGYRVETTLAPTFAHFFHGHDFARSSSFTVLGNREGSPRGATVVVLREIKVAREEESGKSTGGGSVGPSIAITDQSKQDAPRTTIIPVTEEGALVQTSTVQRAPRRHTASGNGQPVVFIPPESLTPSLMSDMWNDAVKERRESEVINAMRILEPGLEDIVFLSGDATYDIRVAIREAQRRVPLGSLGEGMRRMLAIALALIQARGGLLLIDEIDTGLHYSVMGDMWKLVVETARRSDVQVFATTHSLDCVRGLAWLCDNYPALAKEVSVQKIEASLDESIALDAKELVLAVEQEMEVR